MSNTYSNAIIFFSKLLTTPLNRRRRALTQALASEKLHIEWPVNLDGETFVFHCPSSGAVSSAHYLNSQEPETRTWIQNHVKPDDVVWDIGANIGLYSLYAAKLRSATIYAFEPNAGTYNVLTQNIMLNNCGDNIYPLQIALSNKEGLADFYLWRKGAGHALSAIGKPENVFGSFKPAGKYKCLEVRSDTVGSWPGVRHPDHIKIDVDGHELEILRGARNILDGVKSVCIEWEPNTDTENQKIKQLIESHGLFIEEEPADGTPRNVVFVRHSE